MLPAFQSAICTEIIQENYRVRRYFFETENSISFTAGQFVTLDLPIHEKRLQRLRSYSIANAPDGQSRFELCIGYYDNGLASSYIFDNIHVGENIRYKGPQGVFTFRDSAEKHVFICTGTGIVPFRSMILDLKSKQTDLSKIHLLFGTKTSQDLIYHNELNTLLGNRFTVCLSRETNENFHNGYIHAYYEPLVANNTHFYICGWRNMVDETKLRLTQKGIAPSYIFEELYG